MPRRGLPPSAAPWLRPGGVGRSGGARGGGAAPVLPGGVLPRLVRALVALEEDEELVAFARKALAGSGVDLVRGPLARGGAKGAPYDFILIDGAVEQVPAE